jgi:hypothetical protein
LEEQARAQQAAIDTNDPELSKEQKKVLADLKKIDITGFEANTLRLFMNVVNNVVMNENMAGAGIFEVKAEARNVEADGFLKWLEDRNYKVRGKTKRGKTGQNLSSLKSAFSSTEQIIQDIANNASSLAGKIYQLTQIDRIKSGYTKTVQDMKSKVIDKLNILFQTGLSQDADTNIKLTMYSWLMQDKNGTAEENRQEFIRRLKEIKKDINVKEEFGKEQDKEEAALIKKSYSELRTKILDDTGIDIDLETFDGLDKTILDKVGFISDKQREAYDLFRNVYDETRPQFEEIMEKYLNKEFVGWNNYMPDSFRQLKGGITNVEINAENFGNSVFAREADPLDPASGAFNERVEGNRLVEPKGTDDTRVINYNFFDNNLRNSKEMMFDINTLKDRQVASDIFSNKDIEKEVGIDNMEILKKTMVKELMNMTGMKGKSQAKYLQAFKNVSNTIGSLAAKMQLFSVSAYFKQAWSAYMNTAVYLGKDAVYMAKALNLIDQNKDVKELVDKNEISLRGGTQAGTNIFTDNNLAEVYTRVNKTDMADKLKDFSDKITGTNKLTGEEKSMMRHFLERGDVVSAQSSWVALYGQYLINNGVYDSWANIDWAKENENPSRDAAAYAQITTSKQLNVNSRNAFGEVYTDPNAALSILKSIFGLFGNFGFNKSVSLINNAATLSSSTEGIGKEQRSEELEFARKSLAGGMAEEIAFQFVKGMLVKLTIAPLFWGLMGLLSDDDKDDEAIARAKARTLDLGQNAKQFLSNTVSNYFFSFAGTQGQEAISGWANDLYKMFGGKENVFFEASDDPNRPKSGGLLNAAFGGTPEDLKRLWTVMFDRTDRFGAKVEEPSRKEYIWSAVSILSNLAQLMKVNDADVNRLIQKRVDMVDREMDKRYKEPYYMDVSKMAAMSEELKIGGIKRKLSEEQQTFYYKAKKERLEQLKGTPMSDEQKSQYAVKYAKDMLLREYGPEKLEIIKPESPGK